MQKIGFKKSEKTSVARWIERQFEEKEHFPGWDKDDPEQTKPTEDYKKDAIAAWQQVPLKRRLIVEWIEQWMSKREMRKLCRYLDKIEKSRTTGD